MIFVRYADREEDSTAWAWPIPQ